MFDLELYAGGQERRALQQSGDHRIGAVGEQAAEPFGDAGIFLREFRRLLAQNLQLAIVEVEELAVHQSRSTLILPESSSTSATNSTGTSIGSARRSALMKNLIRNASMSTNGSRPDLQRARREPRLKGCQRLLQFARNLDQPLLVDGAGREIREAEIQHRPRHLRRVFKADRRVQVDRVQQIAEVAAHFTAQTAFRYRRPAGRAARGNNALAVRVAQIERLLGVAFLVRGAKGEHQRRRQAFFVVQSHPRPPHQINKWRGVAAAPTQDAYNDQEPLLALRS